MEEKTNGIDYGTADLSDEEKAEASMKKETEDAKNEQKPLKRVERYAEKEYQSAPYRKFLSQRAASEAVGYKKGNQEPSKILAFLKKALAPQKSRKKKKRKKKKHKKLKKGHSRRK